MQTVVKFLVTLLFVLLTLYVHATPDSSEKIVRTHASPLPVPDQSFAKTPIKYALFTGHPCVAVDLSPCTLYEVKPL